MTGDTTAREKVEAIMGLKLLSHFLKALAVRSQLLNPSPSCMGVNAQLPAHSPIGSLLRKIQLCCLHLLLQPVLGLIKKSTSAFQALPALEADPIVGPFLNTRSVFSAPERTTTGTTFFSSIDYSHLSLPRGGGSTRFHTLPNFCIDGHYPLGYVPTCRTPAYTYHMSQDHLVGINRFTARTDVLVPGGWRSIRAPEE